MSSASVVVEKWIKIPNVDTVCVQGSANLVVDVYNKEHVDHKVTYVKISEGWYLEVGPQEIHYRLMIAVKDLKGVVFIIQAILIEIGRLKKVISIHPGCHDPEGKFWIKILNVKVPCVEAVAKYAVDAHNKEKDDVLHFLGTIEGWYFELDEFSSLRFWLHFEVSDCLGRVLKYKAIVKEEKKGTVKVRTLQYFDKI